MEKKELPSLLWLFIPGLLIIALFTINGFDHEGYLYYIESEYGALEILHIIVPAVAAFIALKMLFAASVRQHGGVFALMSTALVCCVYVAGEEASWGQHYFGWSTGEGWSEINDQQETNLHNTSAWLDQKPRILLELGVIVGGIILPILLWLRRVPMFLTRFASIFPSRLSFLTATLAEGSRLIERVGLEGVFFFPDMIRYSEIQEFYFYWFVLLYLWVMHRRFVTKAVGVS